jgi:hypothetical protein
MLCLSSLSLGLGLLVGAEMLVRWGRPAVLATSRVHREHVFSEAYGWVPRPRTRGVWSNGKSFSINSSGYRGTALGDRGASSKRILVAGDSVAFGTGVDDKETFAARLQAPGSPFEVANLAVSGYGTDQELLKLENEGPALDPDVVVLSICLFNDHVDNALDSYLHDPETPKPRYVVEGDDLVLRDEHLRRSWATRIGLRFEENSHLFNALRLLVAPEALAAGPAPSREHWVARRNHVLADFGPVADLSTRLVVRIARFWRGQGVAVLVLLHPDRESFEGDDRLVAPFEAAAVRASGARIVDLRRRYWDARLDFDQVAFDDIGHLTSTGHSVVAEILRSELSSGSVP